MSADTHSSSTREAVLEHCFLAAVLRILWLRHAKHGAPAPEVLRAEVDAHGYDVVVGVGQVTRHIQLKSSVLGGRASEKQINARLCAKPSGCVVWMVFEPETLDFSEFRYLGAGPGEPLEDISHYKRSKRATPTTEGGKPDRPNTFVVRKSQFQALKTAEQLVEALFGPAT